MSYFCNYWCIVSRFIYDACDSCCDRYKKLYKDDPEGKLDKFEHYLRQV
jgi:hypothetical protein